MKNPTYICVLLSIVLIQSCAKDKETISALNYDGKAYSFSHGLQEDWGAHTGTHYNMDFTLVGENTFFERNQNALGETYFTFNQDFDFYVFVEFFSAGTDQFTNGNFRFLGNDDFADITEENVYRRFWFGSTPGELLRSTGGTVKISTSKAGTYTISFDVTLDNNKAVKGTFIGIPEYVLSN